MGDPILNQLLQEVSKKSDYIFNSWNVLIVAGLAVLVVCAFQKKQRRLSIALSLGFVFFAMTHLLGMMHVLKQWQSLETTIHQILKNESDLKQNIGFAILAPKAIWVVPFHFAFDFFILASVYWISREKVHEQKIESGM